MSTSPSTTTAAACRDVAGIVLAGGSGTRVGAGVNKAFLPLQGRAVASWSLRVIAQLPQVATTVFVVRSEDMPCARDIVETDLEDTPDMTPIEIITGGATRQESELCALRHLAERITRGDISTVLIHDAARPLLTEQLAAGVLDATIRHGGAIPALPVRAVAKREFDGSLSPAAHEEESLLRVQTPQGFDAPAILAAYEQAAKDGFVGTDTASCAERYTTLPVTWVMGEDSNIKITYPHDVMLAHELMAARDQQRQEPTPPAAH